MDCPVIKDEASFEANSQPPDEDTKQGIVLDSKEVVMPKLEAETAKSGDFYPLESTNIKMDLKTEGEVLDFKAKVKIIHDNFIAKSDAETGNIGDVAVGGVAAAGGTTTPEGNLDNLSYDKQASTLKECDTTDTTMLNVVPSGVNKEIIPSINCGGAMLPVEGTKIGDPPTLPEAAGSRAKRPKYKKRKKPPPFIGPQRPIQYEDLEDIMNGVYDLHFDTLDTDEEPSELSSSNESCDSSDPEGWLVASGDEGAVGSCKVSSYVNKSLELVKTKLDEAQASKDRLDETINFVGVEANVAALDATVREMVSAAEPQLQAGLDALTALAAAPIAALSLVKHTHLLETAARLCQYAPPPAPFTNRPSRSVEPGVEQAMKICNEAEHILGRMMSLFGVKSCEDFWKVIVERVEKFQEQTKDMTTDQIFLLTEYPAGCNVNESGNGSLPRSFPMMTIDNPREVEGFADDESEAEQVPGSTLKEIDNNKGSRRGSKSGVRKDGNDGGKKKRENRKKKDPPGRENRVQSKKRKLDQLAEVGAADGVLAGEKLPLGGSAGYEKAEKKMARKDVRRAENVGVQKPIGNLETKGKSVTAVPAFKSPFVKKKSASGKDVSDLHASSKQGRETSSGDVSDLHASSKQGREMSSGENPTVPAKKKVAQKGKSSVKSNAVPAKVSNSSITKKQLVPDEDEVLLIDSDDSTPFSEGDRIGATGNSASATSRIQPSFETDSGMFSGTSYLEELPSQQTIPMSSELPMSDVQLLQSSDSDY